MDKNTGIGRDTDGEGRIGRRIAEAARIAAFMIVSFTATLLMFTAQAFAVAAPPGPSCAATNTGLLDLTCPANTFCSRGGNFSAGEQLSFSITVTAGPFVLRDATNTVVIVSVAFPATSFATYTLPATGSYTFHYDNTASAQSTTISATCAGAAQGATMNKDLVANFVSNHWNAVLGAYSEHRTPLPFKLSSPDDVFQDGSGTSPQISALGGTLQFSASVRDLVLGAARAGRIDAASASPLPQPQRWDFWVKGTWTGFENDDGNTGQQGDTLVAMGGVDYLVTDTFLVGMLAGYDWGEQHSGALDTKYDVSGFIAGPYASVRLTDELTLYGRAAYGIADHEFSTGTVFAEADSERFLAMANLRGTYWDLFPVRLTPNVSVQYVAERIDGFTASDATVVGAQTVELGRLEFGGEIGYRRTLDNGNLIDPYVSFHGLWDFANEGQLLLGQGIAVDQADLRARVGAGVILQLGPGAHALIGAEYDGIGAANYDAWSVHGRVAIPLD